MPGMAAQTAPRQAKKPAAPKRQAEEKKSVRQKLHALPQAAGIVAMALLLVLSLFVGNFRALQNASPKAFLRYGDVKSIVEDRVDAATNARTVALRADIDPMMTDSVNSALRDMETAKTAREISRADQALTAAVSEMIAAASETLSGENLTMLTRAADDFAEQGSFLRQEARSYNVQAEKAEKLYEKLPTKFLLAEPDVYEGVPAADRVRIGV